MAHHAGCRSSSAAIAIAATAIGLLLCKSLLGVLYSQTLPSRAWANSATPSSFAFFCACGDSLILCQVFRAHFFFPFDLDAAAVLAGWYDVDTVCVDGDLRPALFMTQFRRWRAGCASSDCATPPRVCGLGCKSIHALPLGV
uniref:Uncharacterized protein n=1 Tax=Ralstonia syzygii R24 TaxID=907261 RepID=G2ZY75_9RALS|nr:hypothetical protein RALSY_11278 [Ralstonia syzygii R24]